MERKSTILLWKQVISYHKSVLPEILSALCVGSPISPNVQAECLLFCLAKGLEIQGLGWQEQSKLTRFHLWASLCIRKVLVHPNA